jgi:lipoprotein-anchoring transpeptidase ErfK/SrfK
MRRRWPTLPVSMEGGPQNPLGSRALYLYQNGRDTLYRIHGTNSPLQIGEAVSSGCIRMHNEHAIDLYNRVGTGTKVIVR